MFDRQLFQLRSGLDPLNSLARHDPSETKPISTPKDPNIPPLYRLSFIFFFAQQTCPKYENTLARSVHDEKSNAIKQILVRIVKKLGRNARMKRLRRPSREDGLLMRSDGRGWRLMRT